MVEFSQEELRRLAESDKCRCQNIFKGTGFRVYVKNKIGKQLINIFAFDNVPANIKMITEEIYRDNLKFTAEESAEKNRFIDFNDYVISLHSSEQKPDDVNFADAALYKKQGAVRCKISSEVAKLPLTHCNRIVVIDHKLLIICNHHETKALCVLDDELRLIPLTVAEQLLRITDLSPKTLEALMTTYPQEHWTLQNDMAINPQTLSVPSSLQYYFYKAKKRSRQSDGIKANMDFMKLVHMLTRNEKGDVSIKYIDSRHI